MKTTQEERQEIRRLKKAGNTYAELATLYDISIESVRKILNSKR